MTVHFQRQSLVGDAFYASLTGVPLRQGKKTHRTDRGTYTMKNAVLESTYMRSYARAEQVCDPSDRPKCSVLDERTLETWQDLGRGDSFGDDRQVNDYLFYKRDARRSIGSVLFAPAEAWEVFAGREIGLSPREFLATGATIDQLTRTLDSYKALDDGGRVALHFLLSEALNECVDEALADLCARITEGLEPRGTEDEARGEPRALPTFDDSDEADEVTPVTPHASTAPIRTEGLGGFVYINGAYVWCGR